MMNPMEMISLLKGRNPEELVMSMIKNNNINDPTINELIGYAKNGDNENLTKLAESIFQKPDRLVEGMEMIMGAICNFVEELSDYAETSQEKEVIRKHLNKMKNI